MVSPKSIRDTVTTSHFHIHPYAYTLFECVSTLNYMNLAAIRTHSQKMEISITLTYRGTVHSNAFVYMQFKITRHINRIRKFLNDPWMNLLSDSAQTYTVAPYFTTVTNPPASLSLALAPICLSQNKVAWASYYV